MGYRTKAYKRRLSAHRNNFCDSLTEEDFIKAKEALERANVPGPYRIFCE